MEWDRTAGVGRENGHVDEDENEQVDDADEPGGASDHDDGLVEWTRRDGLATVRVRERADGGFVVRYDRLEQAPEGETYRRERCADRETALELAAAWRD